MASVPGTSGAVFLGMPGEIGDSMTTSLAKRWSNLRRSVDVGMTTAEYAVGTLAACTFAAVLLAVVRSGAVETALSRLITTALAIAS